MLKKISIMASVLALVILSTNATLAHETREVESYQFVVGFTVEPAFEGVKNGVSLRVTKPADAMAGMEMGMDVNEHGSIFSSPSLEQNQTFEFEVTHALEGMTIPFHSHLNHDMTGSITVNDMDGMSGIVEIEIHGDEFHPADLTVQPDTKLVFTNTSEILHNVTSGLAPEAGHDHEEVVEMVPVEGLQDTLQVEVTHVPTNVAKTVSLRTIFRDPGHYTSDMIPTAPGHYRFKFFGTIEGNAIDAVFDSRSGGGQFSDMEAATDLVFPEAIPSGRELESAVRGVQASVVQAQDAAISADDSASSASLLGIIGIVLGGIGIATGAGSAVLATRNKN